MARLCPTDDVTKDIASMQERERAKGKEVEESLRKKAFFDELSKIGAISDEQAAKALERYEALERSKPTGGQVARYGAIGAVAAPAIGAIGDVISGKRFEAGKRLRGHLGRAVTGALTSGAIPIVRAHFDRRAEMGTLKKYLAERGIDTAHLDAPTAGKLSAPFEPVEKTAGSVLRRALRSLPRVLNEVDGRVIQQLQQEGLASAAGRARERLKGKEKDSGSGITPARSWDATGYTVDLVKGAFATSAYSANLPYPTVPQKSFQPGFRAPNLARVTQADPQSIKTSGVDPDQVMQRGEELEAMGRKMRNIGYLAAASLAAGSLIPESRALKWGLRGGALLGAGLGVLGEQGMRSGKGYQAAAHAARGTPKKEWVEGLDYSPTAFAEADRAIKLAFKPQRAVQHEPQAIKTRSMYEWMAKHPKTMVLAPALLTGAIAGGTTWGEGGGVPLSVGIGLLGALAGASSGNFALEEAKKVIERDKKIKLQHKEAASVADLGAALRRISGKVRLPANLMQGVAEFHPSLQQSVGLVRSHAPRVPKQEILKHLPKTPLRNQIALPRGGSFKALQRKPETRGFVSGVTTGAGRRAVNTAIGLHEGFEKAVRPERIHPVATHLSPDVLIKEHNMLARMTGPGAQEARDVFSKMRHSTGEAEAFSGVLHDAFGPRMANFQYGQGEKIPKAMRNRLFDHIKKMAAGAPTPGNFMMASEVPAFRSPTLKSPLQTQPQQIVEKLGGVPTTPAGRLANSKRIGAPRVTPPPGPSIAQISKPVGYGKPAAGAAKGTI
jgi:hypothetical protein